MPRVLILEDEPLIAMMVEGWLDDLDCRAVGPVNSVAGALALIAADKPDAAILDISLRGEESYPVADVLAARGIPFAFTTGHPTHHIAEAHANAPVLAKPYDFEGFKAVLAALL